MFLASTLIYSTLYPKVSFDSAASISIIISSAFECSTATKLWAPKIIRSCDNPPQQRKDRREDQVSTWHYYYVDCFPHVIICRNNKLSESIVNIEINLLCHSRLHVASTYVHNIYDKCHTDPCYEYCSHS